MHIPNVDDFLFPPLHIGNARLSVRRRRQRAACEYRYSETFEIDMTRKMMDRREKELRDGGKG